MSYAFGVDSGRYLDPTCERGIIPDDEVCRWGLLATDAAMARINEPAAFSAGGRANVAPVELEDAAPYADSLLIGVVAPIAVGEELLMRYGDVYDRSSYAEPS